MTWAKGQSGNPGGRKTEIDVIAFRDKCRHAAPKAFEELERMISDTTLKAGYRISAIKLLFEYAYGRPSQTLIIKEAQKAIENRTTPELQEIADRMSVQMKEHIIGHMVIENQSEIVEVE